jgi:hypothetical protein
VSVSAAGAALPPWEARSDAQRRAMTEWSIAQLDALDAALDALSDDDAKDWTFPPEVLWRERFEAAKQAARRGNLGPLRKLFPELAEFIHEPKRVRGQRRPYVGVRDVFRRHARREVEQRAVDSVHQLRSIIWPRYYGRKKRRDALAEEVAATRCGLTVEQMRRAMKTRKASPATMFPTPS